MKLLWDQTGERLYETGVSNGVLYIPTAGDYVIGYAWNGLTTVTESPSGAEPTPWYADNKKYLNVLSRENFAATIEALTYPNAFAQCDGTAEPVPGVFLAQQPRKLFGFCYKTLIGNDELSTEYGYKLHMVYGALAAPSERAHATVNDSPESVTFSWSVSTTEVEVDGFKPTASVSVDSTKVGADQLAALEAILYGDDDNDPRLPLPDEIIDIVGAASVTVVTPTKPAYDGTSHTITIPTVAGVQYLIDNQVKPAGPVVLTVGQQKLVRARATAGHDFAPETDSSWQYNY